MSEYVKPPCPNEECDQAGGPVPGLLIVHPSLGSPGNSVYECTSCGTRWLYPIPPLEAFYE